MTSIQTEKMKAYSVNFMFIEYFFKFKFNSKQIQICMPQTSTKPDTGFVTI